MRKNVASQVVGAQMVSATDGSAFTGSVTCSVTLDGGTQATGSVGSGACTHEGNGYHTYAPSQAETNGNLLAYTFTGSGAVPVTVQIFTVGYDPYQAQVPANVTQFGGSNGTFSGGRPEVNTTHWGGTAVASANVLIDGAITAAKIASNALTDAKIASGAFTAAKFAAGAFDAVWSVATRLLTAGTNIVLAKGTGVTGFNDLDAAGVRSAVGLASANLDTQLSTIDTVVDRIEVDTQDLQTQIGTDGDGLTAIGDTRIANLDAAISTRATPAQVNSEVDTALADIHLDHLLATAYDPASKPGSADALLNELVENDGGVARFTANALEQAPTGGSAPSAADIADAVWTEAIADHSGVSGSTAEALAAAGGAGDPWITSLPGSYTGTQAGKILADILADTAEIGAAGAGLTALGDARLANLDATVSSRLATAGYTAPLDAAGVRTAVGLATANLDTQLGTIDSNVDAVLADTGTDGVVVATNNDKTGYSVGTGGISAAAFAAGAIDSAAIDANAIDASALSTDAVTEIVSGVFARTFSSAYNSHTFDEMIKLFASVLAGKVSGMNTTEVRFRNLADGADVVVATVDADGNRAAVTRNP